MKLDVNYWMNFYAMERSGKPWPAALQPAVCARAQLASPAALGSTCTCRRRPYSHAPLRTRVL